jgi:sugar O-acyltransferase (sialic acid O-acetyltransferase NeuD family)
MNFIIGAGGFAKEVAWLFYEAFEASRANNGIYAFVVDDESKEVGLAIHGHPIINESKFTEITKNTEANIYIGIGSGELRRKIVEKHKKNHPGHKFPPLIHPSVIYDKRPGAVVFHEGAIICAGCILTTDIIISSFTQINLNCTIGHDSRIGAFSTVSPGAHISGKVEIGDLCFIGTNASIIENIKICPLVTVGAGATVVRDISSPGTYIGTPARII